ncbi:MAG: tRNA pseudouridine(55) synthase TruB [bacterium]|nr:tRNA pseudouridine(55) synthase TruB [bacterium]
MFTPLPENILLVDKPSGITSFDCIRILRKKLGVRKMGHAGTLDPMATGLMIIGVGEGTKRLQEFLRLPKTYEAEILLGIRTDTGDITGKTLEEFSIPNSKFSKKEIEEMLRGMVGKLPLPVPAYSAIKRGGEALYKKARRGEVVDTPIKPMEITAVEFLGLFDGHSLEKGNPEVKLDPRIREDDKRGVRVRFDVTSGTYIRSLAEELGRRLGVPATLAGLRRTRIGEFRIEEAEVLDLK